MRMHKSNLIVVDFRPRARRANMDELSAELEMIDTALAIAHARARELDAVLKAAVESGPISSPRWLP